MNQIQKENTIGNKDPLFLRFINREVQASDLLKSFSKSPDTRTVEIVVKAMQQPPPDLEIFRKEIEDAVRDIIKEGLAEEFKAFVNHYTQESLVEEQQITQGPLGESRVQIAVIKDEQAPWLQGFICYNLCLYIKAFGLSELKACKVCGKLFAHKGQYAVYCSDSCKAKKAPDANQK